MDICFFPQSAKAVIPPAPAVSLEQNNSQRRIKCRLPVCKSIAEFCVGVVVKGLMPSAVPKLFPPNVTFHRGLWLLFGDNRRKNKRSPICRLCRCEFVGDAVQHAGNCYAGVCSCRVLTIESSVSIAQRLLSGAPRKRKMKRGLSLNIYIPYNFVLALFLCDLRCCKAVRNC